MCKVCELSAKCDLIAEELQFRVVQYQKELKFNRPEDAKDAKEYALIAIADMFNVLDEIVEAKKEIVEDDFIDLTKKDSVH